MSDHSELDAVPPGGDVLRIEARLRDLERRLPAQRFRLRLLQWVYLPLLGATLVAMVVALVLGIGEAKGEAVSAVLLAGLVVALVGGIRRMSEGIVDLEEERDAWLQELAPGTGDDTPRLDPGE